MSPLCLWATSKYSQSQMPEEDSSSCLVYSCVRSNYPESGILSQYWILTLYFIYCKTVFQDQGMVEHTCNFIIHENREGVLEFEANLGFRVNSGH